MIYHRYCAVILKKKKMFYHCPGARLKFVNLTNDLLVAENNFINITFYMTTENCSVDPLYTIIVSTSVDKVDEKTDLCKIRVRNGAYLITDHSKSCRMCNSGNKIEFSQEVHPSVRKLIFIVSTSTATSVYTVIPGKSKVHYDKFNPNKWLFRSTRIYLRIHANIGEKKFFFV